MPEIIALRGQTILVDDAEYKRASKYNWFISKRGNTLVPLTNTNNKVKTFSNVVFRIKSGQGIYHKNKDPLDFRRCNIIICSLRVCGYLLATDRKSKYKYYGVVKIKQRWVSRFTSESGKVVDEWYEIEEEAALAADYHAVQNYGDLARRNFPDIGLDELTERYFALRKEVKKQRKERLSKFFQGQTKGSPKFKPSKYIGVSLDSCNKVLTRWSARVTYLQKVLHLGSFDSEIDAAIVYDKKVVDLFGKNAIRNFPELSFEELERRYNDIFVRDIDISITEKLSRLNQGVPKKHSDNKTSKYVGVSWSKHTKKWVAQLTYINKPIVIGYFATEIEAAKAYDLKALELFGNTAKLNFRE